MCQNIGWLCPSNCASHPGACEYSVAAGISCPSGTSLDMYCGLDCSGSAPFCWWWGSYSCVECLADWDCGGGGRVCAVDRHICIDCWRDGPNFDMCHNQNPSDPSKWFCEIFPDGKCKSACREDLVFVPGVGSNNAWGACDYCGWQGFNLGCFTGSMAGPLCPADNGFTYCRNPCTSHQAFSVLGGVCGNCDPLTSTYACDFNRGSGVAKRTHCLPALPGGGCYESVPSWLGRALGWAVECSTGMECVYVGSPGSFCDRTWWDKGANAYALPGDPVHLTPETWEGEDVSNLAHCLSACPSYTGRSGSSVFGTCEHCRTGIDCLWMNQDPCPTLPGTALSCERSCDTYSTWGTVPAGRHYCVDNCPERSGRSGTGAGTGFLCAPCSTNLDCLWPPYPLNMLVPPIGSKGDTCFTPGSPRYPPEGGGLLSTCDVSCPNNANSGYIALLDICMELWEGDPPAVTGGFCITNLDCYWKGSAGPLCAPGLGGCVASVDDWVGQDPILRTYLECRTGADCMTRAESDTEWVGYHSYYYCDVTTTPHQCVPQSTCVSKKLGAYGFDPGAVLADLAASVDDVICAPLDLMCTFGGAFAWACTSATDCRRSITDALSPAVAWFDSWETLFATCDYCITGIECSYGAFGDGAWCKWGDSRECTADCGTTYGRFSLPGLNLPNVCYNCLTGLDCVYDVPGVGTGHALEIMHACDWTSSPARQCKHSTAENRGTNCPEWAGRVGIDLDRAAVDLANVLTPVIDAIAAVVTWIYPACRTDMFDNINRFIRDVASQIDFAVSTCYYGCVSGLLECVSDRTNWGWCDTITDLHPSENLATVRGHSVCVDENELDPRLGRIGITRTAVRCVSGAECYYDDLGGPGLQSLFHTCDHTNNGTFGHVINTCRHTQQNEDSCPALAGRTGVYWDFVHFMGDCRNCWTGMDCGWHETGHQRLCRLNSVLDPTLYPHNIPNPLEGDPYSEGACVLNAESKDGLLSLFGNLFTAKRCDTMMDCWWCNATGPVCQWEAPWLGCRPCDEDTEPMSVAFQTRLDAFYQNRTTLKEALFNTTFSVS